MNTTPVMQFRNVSRSFKTQTDNVDVLRDVNLDINKGEFLFVTGPSGSGKSTFLHLCALIDNPSSGSIILENRDISRLDDTSLCRIRKTRIGLVFQNFCLLPHRSVRDNVMLRFRYLDQLPPEAQSMTDSAIRQMKIDSIQDRTARLLSSGEQQRVSIARAVALKPLILLADEPTGNLDTESINVVMSCLKDLHSQGMTILMVTHNEELLRYATRHLICKNKTLIEKKLS